MTTQMMPPRKSFTGHLQTAWDSTSLGALKKCPRFYEYSILRGLQARDGVVHLDFGGWFHEVMEIFDHARVSGTFGEPILLEAIRHVLVRSARRSPDGAFLGPWESSHSSKNLESLIRSIIWYFDQYAEDAFEVIRLANGKAAVELSFNFALPSVGGTDMVYCGHLDALGTYGGETYFLDRKTTGMSLTQSFFAQFSPSVQMNGYALASQVAFSVPAAGGIIDAVQVGAGFSRFGRHILLAPPGTLEEWLDGAVRWIGLAEQFATEGHWPMNETSCSSFGGCAFQGICSRSPASRERFLEANYQLRVWDPLVPR